MIQDIFIFTQYNLTMLQLYLEDPGVHPAAADVQAGGLIANLEYRGNI